MNEEQLLELKQDIDAAKTTVSELNGTLQHQMKQLNDNWNCKTVVTAKEKSKTFDTEIEKLDKQIDNGCAELEEKYLKEE